MCGKGHMVLLGNSKTFRHKRILNNKGTRIYLETEIIRIILAGTQKGTTGVFTEDSDFPYGILIVVSIGVALGVFFGGLLLSVAVMYMRRYVSKHTIEFLGN